MGLDKRQILIFLVIVFCICSLHAKKNDRVFRKLKRSMGINHPGLKFNFNEPNKDVKKHGHCVTDKDCPSYSHCYKKSCTCRFEYHGDGMKCKADPPKQCSSDEDCPGKSAGKQHAKCGVDNKCRCVGMYAGNGDYCRAAKSCPKNAKCGSNAYCMIDPLLPNSHLCPCKEGFWKEKNGKCIACWKTSHCPAYSKCENKQCTCKKELVLGKRGCEPAPLHKCNTDDDCHAEAKCEEGKCHCQGKYVGNGKNCRRVIRDCNKGEVEKCGSNSIDCKVDPLMDRHTVCKCKPGFYQNHVNGTCAECLGKEHCSKTYSICKEDKCTCPDELIMGETSCEPAPLHTCQANKDCDSRAKCEGGKCICQGNTIGNGKYCRDSLACPAEHQCGNDLYCVVDPLLPDKPECRCREGFAKSPEGNCEKKTECTKQGVWCSPGTTCVPAEGTNTATCQDIDECSDVGICPENSVCKNSEGSYKCECNSGYRMGDNDICEDVDECSDIADACRDDQICINGQGKYSCECDTGYVKKGDACVKMDECNCKKNAKCIQGKCVCKKGYKKDKRGHCHHVHKNYLAGSGDSIHVSSYLGALILGMLGRLAFTA
ncbi:uncharacterized protein LOC144657745 isoform X1 [Oculina patagonica]